jgi:rhodanese-related sulfurtransferase/Fe-S cluster assembly iron-binding protein IscA
MAVAPAEAPQAPPSDPVILFALDLAAKDPARDTITALCEQYGHTPLLIDAATDPLFAEHVRDPATRAHFPLLCVRGALVGGVEILRSLEATGKLEALLNPLTGAAVPTIALSQKAAEVIHGAMTGPESCLRIVISPEFDHDIAIDEATPNDVQFRLGDIPCVLDEDSATRADGLAIDWIEQGETQGFRIDNPNRPDPVHFVDGAWVETNVGIGSNLLVIDVRSKLEYDTAHLPDAVALEASLIDALEAMNPHTPLFFYCKNGVKSRLAAERYQKNGFMKVYCLEGGLDAWNVQALP